MRKHSAVFSEESLKADPLYKWFPLAAIILLATALRLYQLGNESLWVDEFHSLRATAELKLHFRVLYFALLRLWMGFSTNDVWLRSISVIFGVGCVFLTYRLAYRLVGRAVGLISAFMVAVSPLFIWHSQEVRFYMLSTFLTLAGTLALVYALERLTVASVGSWIAARLLAVYATPINLLLVVPDIILILLKFRHQRRLLGFFAGGLLALMLLFLPVASNPEFIGAIQRFLSTASNRLPGVGEILGQLPAATVFWPMQQAQKGQIVLLGLHGLISLFLLGFLAFNKKRSSRLNWLAAWAFIPLGILLVVSYFSYIWSPRYLLISTPYVMILLAAGFVQVWHWRRAVAYGIATVYVVALGMGLFHYYGRKNVTDWRGAVQIIHAQEQVGDRIVVPLDFIRDWVFGHYYSGSTSVEVVPSLVPNQPVNQIEIAEDLRQLSSDSSRLWLIYRRLRDGNKKGQHQQALQAAIDSQFEVQQHEVFSGYLDTLDLFLLTPQVAAQIE